MRQQARNITTIFLFAISIGLILAIPAQTIQPAATGEQLRPNAPATFEIDPN